MKSLHEQAANKYIDHIEIQIDRFHKSILMIQKIPSLLKIKQADRQYISSLQCQYCQHLMFTRHGESAAFSQKKFGLFPNAPISFTAIRAMQNTSKYTIGLLFYPDSEIDARVSPMIRAKQTALSLLPSFHQVEVRIQSFLTENSEYPSGIGVTSLEQAVRQNKKLSLWSSPLCKIVSQSSLWIFGSEKTYKSVVEKSEQLDRRLQQRNSHGEQHFLGNQMKEKEGREFKIGEFTKQEKLEKISDIIKKQGKKNKDIWLFGHSGLFTSYFKNIFGEKESFEYCEIRSVYHIVSKGKEYLMTPPYKVVINQDNGSIMVKFQPKRYNLKIFE